MTIVAAYLQRQQASSRHRFIKDYYSDRVLNDAYLLRGMLSGSVRLDI
jgi:hypothetical protein